VLATTSSWWLLVSTLTASTYAQSPTVSVTQAGTTFIASWSQPTDSPRFFLGQVLLFNSSNQANGPAGNAPLFTIIRECNRRLKKTVVETIA
jgi:hypothetical protein